MGDMMTTRSPRKVALVGCGGMENSYERALRGLSDRVQVVATVDPVIGKAKRAAASVGAATAVTDYRQILDAVDAVILVIPHHLHHGIGLACLRAGKHVLIEKPLANTEAECQELIDAADQAGRTLMVAYPLRYHPTLLKLKELIDDKTLGEVIQASIWTEQLSNRGGEGGWTFSADKLGGGQLFSHGCHYVDLLLWLLGDPVRGVHLGTHVGTEWMEGEGTSNITLEFASGALGYHFGTWGARGTKLGNSFHVHGTEGMADFDRTAGTLRIHRGNNVELIERTDANSKNLPGELGEFLDCIETGARPRTDGLDSLQGLRIIWRLYEAEERNGFADLTGLGLQVRNRLTSRK